MSGIKKTPTPVTFEDTIEKLESIVASMQDGGASLENSLQNFEEGIHLIRKAQSALAVTEQKLTVLLEKSHDSHFQEGEPDQ